MAMASCGKRSMQTIARYSRDGGVKTETNDRRRNFLSPRINLFPSLDFVCKDSFESRKVTNVTETRRRCVTNSSSLSLAPGGPRIADGRTGHASRVKRYIVRAAVGPGGGE
jgi:hypothetical protein